MPRHNPPTLRPVDPAPAAAVADSPDELSEGRTWVGVEEACRILGRISEWQLRHLVRTGRVRCQQDSKGCRMWFQKAALWAYQESVPVKA